MPSLDGTDGGAGYGVRGESNTGAGVVGDADKGVGVRGSSADGIAVAAQSKTGTGVNAESSVGDGVVSTTDLGTAVIARSSAGRALVAESKKLEAIVASSTAGRGVVARSQDAVAVSGESEKDNGVFGQTDAPARAGVFGYNRGKSDGGTGVVGLAEGLGGIGVFGEARRRGTGVVGDGATGMVARGDVGPGIDASSQQNDGVRGQAQRDGAAAVRGEHSATGQGVAGQSVSGTGVQGHGRIGVLGETDNDSGPGVVGRAGSGAWPFQMGAVVGQAAATAIPGVAGTASGAFAAGVLGRASGGLGAGVEGEGFVGVRGTTTLSGFLAPGVMGNGKGAAGYGVVGLGTGNGAGVLGTCSSGIGVSGMSDGSGTGIYGFSPNPTNVGAYAWAGRFQGAVNVTGPVHKSGGGFRIDHPGRPATHYLQHWFVESDVMRNLYDGVVVLGDDSTAVVQLPRWFEELNDSFCYQLTALGGPAPDLHVAREVSEGSFIVAGGNPRQRIAWQVTGVRKDPWARANSLPAELPKAPEERERYRHPELYDQPPERGIDFMLNGASDQPRDMPAELTRQRERSERKDPKG